MSWLKALWQNDAASALALTLGLAVLGFGGLFLRDYLLSRARRGLPLFPTFFPTVVLTIKYEGRPGPGCRLLLNPGLLLPAFVAIAGLCCIAMGAAGPALLLWSGALLWLCFRRETLASRRQWQAGFLADLSLAMRQRLPLLALLDATATEARASSFRLALVAARDSLAGGQPLSDALARQRLLPPLALALLRAGEAAGGGALPAMARAAAQLLSAELSLRLHLNGLLLYPFYVWLAVLAVAFFLLATVVPRFSEIFAALGPSRLPAAVGWNRGYVAPLAGLLPDFCPGSQWGTAWSVLSNLCVAAACVLALTVIWSVLARAPSRHDYREPRRMWLRRAAGRLLSSLPLLRQRRREHCLANAARALSALIAHHVPLPQACGLVAADPVSGSFARAFERLGTELTRGVPLRTALQLSGLPESFQSLAAAGAAGGNLPAALETAAEWHAAKARRWDRLLTAAVPFIAIPLAGLLVGAFYIGMLSGLNYIEYQMIPCRWAEYR